MLCIMDKHGLTMPIMQLLLCLGLCWSFKPHPFRLSGVASLLLLKLLAKRADRGLPTITVSSVSLITGFRAM
mgnify:FL=1